MQFLRTWLITLVVVLVVVFARAGVGSEAKIPFVETQRNVNEVAEHLDTVFWLADHLDLQQELIGEYATIDGWIEGLNRSEVEFLCLGERHTEAFRRFLAQAVFPKLRLDTLFLEADAEQVEQILAQINNNSASVELLGADITGIIRAVRKRNPNVRIIGVDETDQQRAWKNLEQAHSQRRRLSRDGFIAQNIRANFHAGQRHGALYGANHCAENDLALGNSQPFFRQLMQVIPREKLRSVRLVSSEQKDLFALTLKRTNLADGMFAIADTTAISPAAYNFRWDLKAYFDNYDTIIYFMEDN